MCKAIEENFDNLVGGSTGGGNSFMQSLLDITVGAVSGGTVGFQKDKGGFEFGLFKGPGSRAAKDIFKDLTGATAKEEALQLTRDQMEEQKAQRIQEREDVRASNAATQLSKSRRASATRGRSTSNVGQPSSNNLGSDERDFLGL